MGMTTVRRTTRVATIRWNGKRYRRRVYEFIDPDTRWWRDTVRLGAMSMWNSDSFVPLDTFDEYEVFEEAIGMPGKWM